MAALSFGRTQSFPGWLLEETVVFRAALVCLGTLAWAGAIGAQQSVRGWGFQSFDTEAASVPAVAISGYSEMLLILRADGRLFGLGNNAGGQAAVPQPPFGLTFVKASAGFVSAAILSNGQLVQWGSYLGSPPSPLPTLPVGVTAVDVEAGRTNVTALLSNGAIVAWGTNTWGECNVPVLAGGLSYTSVSSGWGVCAATVSDGSLRAWGYAGTSMLSVPAPGPGLGFTKVKCGDGHALALRSDGQVVAWGSNVYGQCNVPPTPSGVGYTLFDAGPNHSVACRSDGACVAWGDNSSGQCNIPQPPPGTSYVGLFADSFVTIALRSDGEFAYSGPAGFQGPLPALVPSQHYDDVSIGTRAMGVLNSGEIKEWGPWASVYGTIPTLPPGVTYKTCAEGHQFAVATCSDGSLRAWGSNAFGQLNYPALPSGVHYVAVDAGDSHAVALCSDGTVRAWGSNSWGMSSVPAAPVGVSYTQVAAAPSNTLLLRSDGEIIALGYAGGGLTSVPALPPGLRYTQCAVGRFVAAAVRSDGEVIKWGSYSSASPFPPLPPQLSYVEVACTSNTYIARRSDGSVVASGYYSANPIEAQLMYPPPLLPGTSYLRLSAGETLHGALVGRESSYLRIASGCAGSQPAARLVPHDTPQIGRTMTVGLLNLPASAAALVMGWSRITPGVALDNYGMPGCVAHVSLDGIGYLGGIGGTASWSLAIPYQPTLLGVHFYNQAFVFDPASGNSMGAVVSEACEGIVGG